MPIFPHKIASWALDLKVIAFDLNFYRICIFMALTTEKLLVNVINLSKTQGNDTQGFFFQLNLGFVFDK